MEVNLSLVRFYLNDIWKQYQSLLLVDFVDFRFGNEQTGFSKEVVLLVE
jgi:hypothetical protein